MKNKMNLNNQTLGFLINQAASRFGLSLTHKLSESNLGLGFGQFQVLKLLSVYDNISQIEISRLLNKDAAGIKRILDNLEKEEYIVRTAVNKSKNSISLSEKALQLMPQLLSIADENNNLAAQDITESELNQFKDTLIKIINNFSITIK